MITTKIAISHVQPYHVVGWHWGWVENFKNDYTHNWICHSHIYHPGNVNYIPQGIYILSHPNPPIDHSFVCVSLSLSEPPHHICMSHTACKLIVKLTHASMRTHKRINLQQINSFRWPLHYFVTGLFCASCEITHWMLKSKQTLNKKKSREN